MPLRYGFLPSDFNPMLLFLGEPEDLRALAAALDRFARAPAVAELASLLPRAEAPAGERVTVVPAIDRPGLRRIAAAAAGFEWRLDPVRAAEYAAEVAALAAPGRRAGSAMLGPDAAGEREGIPVKVSLGEYLDEVLEPRGTR
jgi:hypothetical protein